jgi:hypothetical protein
MWGIYIHVALLYDYDKLATVGLGTKEVASGHGNYSDLSFFRRVTRGCRNSSDTKIQLYYNIFIY